MVGCCAKTAAGSSLGLGAVLFIVGLVLGFRVFPDAVEEQIAEKILLKEGSESWELWRKLPVPLNFKVYFFNVTNVDEIHEGKMPVVKEIGPFVYNEYKEKENIVVHEAYGTASYQQRTVFHFNEEASYPLKEDDVVTIINVAMMGMVEMAEIESPGLIGTLGKVLPGLFNGAKNIFLKDTVKNILFEGVTVNCQIPFGSVICNKIKEKKPAALRSDKNGNLLFALFYHKNNSYDGYYEVKLGWGPDGPNPSKEGAKTLGRIVSWENSTKLSTWSGEKCNQLLGTDAAIFSPFLTKDSRIDIFSTDLCRSLYAVFDRESSYKGIDSLLFTAEEFLLGDVHLNPDNNCFCPKDNGCLFKGALDLTPCQGAPVILTFPHFYLAGESYSEAIEGVNPERELHETFLELEPNTGITLRGGKRVQFNILMKRVEKVELTHDVPTALFPILWIDEGLDLDDANVNKLKDELINVLNIIEGAKWGLIGTGIALLCLGIGLGIFLIIKSRNGGKGFVM